MKIGQDYEFDKLEEFKYYFKHPYFLTYWKTSTQQFFAYMRLSGQM
jgi:hypothetical protein